MITTQQRLWTEHVGWSNPVGKLGGKPQLVFVFGDRAFVERKELFLQIQQFYLDSYILIGSTAGNIQGGTVSDQSVTISALHFEKTKIWFAETTVENVFDSQNVGKKLAEFLPTEDLVHSFVLSDGLAVNGSTLVQSINQYLPKNVTVTGGLAGDGTEFKKTVVGINTTPKQNRVTLIGFYGNSLKVGYAAKGGWTASGEAYTITSSKGNILYELDGKSALEVYREFLGDEAKNLPSSGLLFPLQLKLPVEGLVVRTILAIDEDAGSITFAGDMPQGSIAHLMHATQEDLINSAGVAGKEATRALGLATAQFAFLISCVGRRLVLKERTEEEVQAVQREIGPKAVIHGFHSYGELCPTKDSGYHCLLHNQTMTVTTFAEI